MLRRHELRYLLNCLEYALYAYYATINVLLIRELLQLHFTDGRTSRPVTSKYYCSSILIKVRLSHLKPNLNGQCRYFHGFFLQAHGGERISPISGNFSVAKDNLLDSMIRSSTVFYDIITEYACRDVAITVEPRHIVLQR